MKPQLFILLFLIALQPTLSAQKKKPEPIIPSSYCLSAKELELYQLINEYRQSQGLEIIPLSKSLSYVSFMHVRDLQKNRPDLSGCNLHSWSGKGSWTPCCYAKEPNRQECMNRKPQELTGYKGHAQEIILWENKPASASSSLEQWKSLEPTNDILIKRGRWAQKNWQAMGVALFEGYTSVWFGEAEDKETKLTVCDDGRQISHRYLIEAQVQARQPAQAAKPPATIQPVDQAQSQASQKSTPGTQPTQKAPDKPQQQQPKAQPMPAKQENSQTRLPQDQQQTKPPAPSSETIAAAPVLQTPVRYYLIVSSFKTLEQARKEVAKLISNGYAEAKFIEKDGNYRISIFDFENMQDAKKEQQTLSDVFKGIWVMEK